MEAIEKVDKKMLKPCKEPAILQSVRLNGQNMYSTVYSVVGAVTIHTSNNCMHFLWNYQETHKKIRQS